MSTAILHAGSFIHDFNDIVMKVSAVSQVLEVALFPAVCPPAFV